VLLRPTSWLNGGACNYDGAVRFSHVLCGHSDTLVEKFWGEVGAVGPRHGMKVRMEFERSKHGRLPKGFENRTIQFLRQIDLPFNSVTETKPQNVISNVTRLCHSDHDLLQWRDRPQGLPLLGELPILIQLVPMELIPLEHMRERPSGEFPSDHTVSNANRNLVLTIYCMKVSWLVFPVEDRDDDAKESTNLWHSFILPPTLNSRTPA